MPGNLTSKIPHMGGQGKQRLALMLVAIAVMAIGILVRIDGEGYLGHRLAWLYMHGHFPDGAFDPKRA